MSALRAADADLRAEDCCMQAKDKRASKNGQESKK
jgi:hypothetical protein